MYDIKPTPAVTVVVVYIDDSGVPEGRCFSTGAPVRTVTTQGLAESQAVLGGHDVVKHRVDRARKEVETPCNICTQLTYSVLMFINIEISILLSPELTNIKI